jgi:hypothetical protein
MLPRERPDWMLDGACITAGVDMHPEENKDVPAAQEVCFRCPVIEQCRTHALEHHEQFGVWGGLSARGRRRILNPIDSKPEPFINHGGRGGYQAHYYHGVPLCDACRAYQRRYEADYRRKNRDRINTRERNAAAMKRKKKENAA